MRRLQAAGHETVFAGNSRQRSFIAQSIPGIRLLHLDGYDVQYSRSRIGFMVALLRQLPRVAQRIKAEHTWLSQLLETEKFDGIISDNRYGLYHKTVPSVILTHQLLVQTGLGGFADELVRRYHYALLEKFGACWVVDVPGSDNLSGKLAHPQVLPKHARYLGLLSQFQYLPEVPAPKGYLLMLLSGPEPQRSILAEKLWQRALTADVPVHFVAGSTRATIPAKIPTHVQYHQQLAASQLLPLLQGAEMVYCRSGYSTLMDLVLLQKKAVLIPTPGQTEQEYLARHLHQRGVFRHVSQQGVSSLGLGDLLQPFPWQSLPLQSAFTAHEPVLDRWLEQL